MLEVGALGLRRSVHEPDEIDAVLGVLQELAGDELAHVSGPDDDRVLKMGDRVAADAARARAAGRHEGDACAPEEDELGKLGRPEAGQPATGVEDPGTDGDEVEHADELVRSRVVRALLVVVVEAVELGHHDPGGKRRDEEQGMPGGDAGTDERLGKDEGDRQSGDVSGGKRAPNDPPTPPKSSRSAFLQALGNGTRP